MSRSYEKFLLPDWRLPESAPLAKMFHFKVRVSSTFAVTLSFLKSFCSDECSCQEISLLQCLWKAHKGERTQLKSLLQMHLNIHDAYINNCPFSTRRSAAFLF